MTVGAYTVLCVFFCGWLTVSADFCIVVLPRIIFGVRILYKYALLVFVELMAE